MNNKQCSKCKVKKYCGVECQNNDWRYIHRGECEKHMTIYYDSKADGKLDLFTSPITDKKGMNEELQNFVSLVIERDGKKISIHDYLIKYYTTAILNTKYAKIRAQYKALPEHNTKLGYGKYKIKGNTICKYRIIKMVGNYFDGVTYWEFPSDFKILDGEKDMELEGCSELKILRDIIKKYNWSESDYLPIKFTNYGAVKIKYENTGCVLGRYPANIEIENIYNNVFVTRCCEKIMEFDQKEIDELKLVESNKAQEYLEYLSYEFVKKIRKSYPVIKKITGASKCPDQSEEIAKIKVLEKKYDCLKRLK